MTTEKQQEFGLMDRHDAEGNVTLMAEWDPNNWPPHIQPLVIERLL